MVGRQSLRRKRKTHYAVALSNVKRPSSGANSSSSGLLEITDAQDTVIKHCEKFLCRDVTPLCVLKACKKCCDRGYSSKWHHISIGEHYCNFCYEFYMHNGGHEALARWKKIWRKNSVCQPSLKLFVSEEILPFWLRCNKCGQWRPFDAGSELVTPSFVTDFSCEVICTPEKPFDCLQPEDVNIKSVLKLGWFETVAVPVLLKWCPASRFLISEYFCDGVGISPTASDVSEDFPEVDSRTKDVMQPFYCPLDDGKAMCIRPDIMETDEITEFPEYSKEQSIYLGIRNTIIALWNINPQEWLTPKYCERFLICRGLVRVLVVHELKRILTFLTQKGVVNYGILSIPPDLRLRHCKTLRVAVIGAGVSGLSAAQHLQNLGADVTVLEAKDMIGGRICDDFSLGVAFGLGGQLITGVINNPFCVMCIQAGIPFRTLNDECPLLDETDGEIVATMIDKRIDFHFNAMLDAVEYWRNKTAEDIDLETALTTMNKLFLKQSDEVLSAAEQRLLNFHLSNLEYSCGSPLKHVSAVHWDQNEKFAQFAGKHALLTDGCSIIVDKLSSGINTVKACAVTEIDYSDKTIRISDASGRTFVCDRVLVTVPLTVLQRGSLHFVPTLPREKTKAINALGIGIIEKVALKFSRNFWSAKIRNADYFGHVPDVKGVKGLFNVYYDFCKEGSEHDDDSFVLMCYLSGEAASLVKRKSDVEVAAMCTAVLRKLFPKEVVPDPLAFAVSHWSEDPFAGMAYSFIKVGAMGEDYDLMAKDVDGKVFFAGEATNRHFPQTFTGAYLSGLREAYKIIKS